MVETTDVVFAVDSIPAIFGVAREPFIVFSSNAFAILGLRSLYFCLNGMQDRFRYLNVGLGVILAFVGVKMLLSFFAEQLSGRPDFHMPTWLSLGVIVAGPDGDDPRRRSGPTKQRRRPATDDRRCRVD